MQRLVTCTKPTYLTLSICITEDFSTWIQQLSRSLGAESQLIAFFLLMVFDWEGP